MNKKVLGALVGVLVVGCIVGMTIAVIKIRKNHHGAAATSRLPHDAFLVAQVDLAHARDWPLATSLRNWLTNPGAGASAASQDTARRYQDLVTHCGFDPWQRVSTVSGGLARPLLTGTDQSAADFFVDGNFTTAEATRCLAYGVEQTHQQLTASEVARHPVQTPVHLGGTAGPNDLQFAMLDRTVLGSTVSYMPRALAVIDGQGPGLEPTSPLATMMDHLGNDQILKVAVDLAAVHAQNLHDFDQLIDDLAHDNPTIPNLAMAKQAQTGGVGLVRRPDGTVALVVRGTFPDNGVAAPFATALNALIQARRGDGLQALDQSQGMFTLMQAGLSLGGADLSTQFGQITAAINAAKQVLNQITVAPEGATVVVTLTVNASQVGAFEAGVRAASDVLAEQGRNSRRQPMFPGLGLPSTPSPFGSGSGAAPSNPLP